MNTVARTRSVPALLREIEAIRALIDLIGDDPESHRSSLEDRSEADTMEMGVDPGDSNKSENKK